MSICSDDDDDEHMILTSYIKKKWTFDDIANELAKEDCMLLSNVRGKLKYVYEGIYYFMPWVSWKNYGNRIHFTTRNDRKDFMKLLIDNHISYETQYHISGFKTRCNILFTFDFYLPVLDIIIEFIKPFLVYKNLAHCNNILKDQYCIDNHRKLLRIRDTAIYNLNLIDEIKEFSKSTIVNDKDYVKIIEEN
jgi:hypothetical protein